VEPRLHRADRQRQGSGDLAVAQFDPGVQQQDLPVARTQLRKRSGKGATVNVGVEAGYCLVLFSQYGINTATRIGAQHAPLLAPVAAKKVRRDPV